MLSIKIIIISIIIAGLFYIYGKKFGNATTTTLIEIPYSVKCYFKEDGCESGNIDYMTIALAVIYFFIGAYIPDHYITVFIVTTLFEFVKPLMGYRSKFIIDPLASITGYALGSVLSCRDRNFKEKYAVLVNGK